LLFLNICSDKNISTITFLINNEKKKSSFFFSDQDLLSAAAWYQEGLPEYICEEYLNRNDQLIGSFIIRYNYNSLNQTFILSIKTKKASIEHFFIQRTIDRSGYQIQVC
jgi:hypothetical protein